MRTVSAFILIVPSATTSFGEAAAMLNIDKRALPNFIILMVCFYVFDIIIKTLRTVANLFHELGYLVAQIVSKFSVLDSKLL